MQKAPMTDLQMFAEIHRSLGRMEGEMKRLVDEVKANNDNSNKNNDEMDGRLRKVENRQYWHSGASSVIGAIGGYILTTIKSSFGV